MTGERRQRITHALVEAGARLARALQSPNPDSAFAPLGETLYWIVFLDDVYWFACCEKGRKSPCLGYETLCDAPNSLGRAVFGLRLAQNTFKDRDLVHLPAMAGEFTRPIMDSSEMESAFLAWKPLDAILDPGQPRDKDGAPQYREYMAGRPVGQTISEVVDFFQAEAPSWYDSLPKARPPVHKHGTG